MKKKMITDLELFGRKIKTKDDLKDVFDVEGFIERRAKITSWLNEKYPKKNKKLSSIESDEEWIKELADILGCPEKYQEYITARKEPDKEESASPVSTDEPKDITPPPSSPKTTPVKVSSASGLREVLQQGCDEICVTGYLADCVCDLIKNLDSSRIEFIRKCEAYLNSPETEEESLKEVMFSLGLNGSSRNDEAYFGILDYNKIEVISK